MKIYDNPIELMETLEEGQEFCLQGLYNVPNWHQRAKLRVYRFFGARNKIFWMYQALGLRRLVCIHKSDFFVAYEPMDGKPL